MPNRVFLYLLKGGFRIAKYFDGRKLSYNIKDISNILLLNTTAMGDTLLSTPAIRALREVFPEARITSFVSPVAKEILLNNPNINRLIDYPGRINLPFFFRLPGILRDLRRERFDISIVLDSNDPEAGTFSYLSGAPIRVGWQESQLSFLFNIPVVKRVEGLHVVDIKFKTLEALGINAHERKPEIFLTMEEERRADEILKKEGLLKDKIFGIHPFGAKRNRWWPEEYVILLSNYLFEKYGFKTIIFGGKKEVTFAERISSRIKERPFVATGKVGIRESAALIKRCSFLICPDSGPMHLAQAVGIPTIALFGPADPASTGPTGGKNIIIRKEIECSPCRDYDCSHISCMKEIRVDDILVAIKEMKKKGWINLLE
ncbi:MAG: glycosyltransferase family 9 protein [Nitrospirae bacterium]|nr:glycosyltransferase family 9 protein [Nitrospirota bacterium]